MDRIIKPNSNTGDSPFRLHNFLPIQEAISRPGTASSNAPDESFKRGLLQPEISCPTLEDMDAMLSKKALDNQRAADGSTNLQSGPADSGEETSSMVCIVERFSQALNDFREERDAIYDRAAEETVKLALTISEKVINHELSVNSDVLLSIVRKAMQKIKGNQSVCIRVHPKDLEALKQTDLETSVEEIVFQADISMRRGDCIMETRQGDIDAGIRNQLKVIEAAFSALGTP